jgi:peptidoglycan hydrolase-like protein with peptidoglycan-binding domain
MFYSYLLSGSALAAVSLGALLYTVTGHGERTVEGAQAPTSADRRPEHFSARYREQMKLTQETLRDLGYTPGAIDGIMGSGTAAALRAFQQREGLLATGRANPETLAALGIEDRLSRRVSRRPP